MIVSSTITYQNNHTKATVLWPILITGEYMKIRKFSHAETVVIKNELINRMKLTKEVHELLIERLSNAYKVYVRDFKYSLLSAPFTFKPVSEEKLLKGILGEHGCIDTVKNKKITRYFPENSLTYVYQSWNSSMAFTLEVDRRLLDLAEYTFNKVLNNDDSLDYISIVMDYADVPFEFDLEDMKRIRLYRAQYLHIKESLEEIRNELSSLKAK